MKLKRLLFIFFSLSSFYSVAIGQINTDSIFQTAISQSKNNQYDSAIDNAEKAFKSDSKRADILVFIANVYSWKNQNDTALVYIHQAIKLNYLHDDLYEAWTNILLRLHRYEDLLKCCDEAEKHQYSNSEDILKKRLIAYNELKMYDKGVSLIESPANKKFLEIKQFNDLYSGLLMKRNSKLLSAYYILDLFDGGNTQPQQLASLGYSFPVGVNNLGFRVNYANRFGQSDIQLESDFYLKLKKQQYMYFNYGYGFKSLLFPTHRLGYEFYFPLGHKLEASIGGRYLNYPTSNVLIATGHIGWYFGNSWVGLRPYYVYAFKTPANTQSVSLIGNYRLFGKTELDYWGVEVGIGNSPDEVYTTNPQIVGFNQLTAYKIKLEKNFMLNRVSDFHIGLGYSREEFSLNQFRNRFTVELGYKLRLK